MAKPCVLLLSATLCALLCSSTHARTLAQVSGAVALLLCLKTYTRNCEHCLPAQTVVLTGQLMWTFVSQVRSKVCNRRRFAPTSLTNPLVCVVQSAIDLTTPASDGDSAGDSQSAAG